MNRSLCREGPVQDPCYTLVIHHGTPGNWVTTSRLEHPEPGASLYGPAWQDKLCQAEAGFAAGRTRSFADGEEFFRHLDGLDDAADK